MKFVKFILVITTLIVIASLIWLSTIDGKYNTSRSRVINAPPEIIYDYVNDFKEWPKWDPWSEAFGDMKIEYTGSDKGVGAKYSWTGEESGEGNMEIITTVPYTAIDQVINFTTPFESSSDIYWIFEKVDGGTKVTWGMKGEMDFFTRPFAVSMDEMMEKDLLRGLAKLDSISVLSANAKTFNIEGIVTNNKILYVGIEAKDVAQKDMGEIMGKNFPKLVKWMTENKVDMAGAPFTLYKNWDEKSGMATFVSCIPVKSKVRKIRDKSITQGVVKPEKCVKTVYRGDYSKSEDAWMETFAFIEEKGLKYENGNPFEIYVTDPGQDPNPENWVTEIYIPVE